LNVLKRYHNVTSNEGNSQVQKILYGRLNCQ